MSELINQSAISKGGQHIECWFKSLLTTRLTVSGAKVVGGSIVPQMGERAGERLRIEPVSLECTKLDISPKDLQKIEKHEAKIYEDRIYARTAICIDDGFDKFQSLLFFPIHYNQALLLGHVWCLADEANAINDQLVKDLTSSIAAVINQEKFRDAINVLSSPIWHHSTTSASSAQYAAKSVRRAISCLASIIWIANEKIRR